MVCFTDVSRKWTALWGYRRRKLSLSSPQV